MKSGRESSTKDVSAAKTSAAQAPVIITDRGRPTHVLLSIADYRRLLAQQRSIVDWLSVDDGRQLEAERLDLQLEAPEL